MRNYDVTKKTALTTLFWRSAVPIFLLCVWVWLASWLPIPSPTDFTLIKF